MRICFLKTPAQRSQESIQPRFLRIKFLTVCDLISVSSDTIGRSSGFTGINVAPVHLSRAPGASPPPFAELRYEEGGDPSVGTGTNVAPLNTYCRENGFSNLGLECLRICMNFIGFRWCCIWYIRAL